MKLFLVAILGLCLGQSQAGPVVELQTAEFATRTRFFGEFDNLLKGIAKEAIESLSTLRQSTAEEVESVENAIENLETLYNDKVLKEIAKYDDVLKELQTKVSPCFAPVPEEISKMVQSARDKAGVCAKATVARVRLIEKNVEEHIKFSLSKVHDIIGIGRKCLEDNSWIVDQINCALQNAPEAVNKVQEIVHDAAKLVAETSKEVAKLAAETEQCLGGAVQDAVTDFNEILGKVIQCLGDEQKESDSKDPSYSKDSSESKDSSDSSED
ncbi:uncharacterized protein LOC128272856 [Anopheles cruzii]|uniref:uncharacterized protein LOC128272856 n=1 Tax=Anopheles cruzii TaxID=68878 RepID=UPI0022EC3EA6|nr:uncharacterized protein LOC128272856 [Anopheles cruzii]